MISEPTLIDVLRMIRLAWKYVAAGMVAGMLAGGIFLSVAVPHYRVTMLVAPAERAARADIKALLPDNPSFALQYLVNTMGSQDSTDFIRFEHTLRGPSVAAILMNDQKIRQGVKEDRNFIFSPAPDLQSAAELSAILEDVVHVEPVGNTPLRKVVFDHPSPDFGIYLLNRLYDQTDRMIRHEVSEKAHQRSLYLEKVLDKTSHPDHRRALTSLLMEQEHILMILAMDEPFAAIIAEPPSVSATPWWPRKSLILPAFAFAGMLAGFALWGLNRVE
jgi:hypothetical protein